METLKPGIADFDKFKTQYPALFPANQGVLPEAVIFYCAQGQNRSPAMAIAYKLWMYQTFRLDLHAQAPPYHICFLTGGYGTFIKANITIQDSLELRKRLHVLYQTTTKYLQLKRTRKKQPHYQCRMLGERGRSPSSDEH